jgi:ATP-dependent DNA helicase RecQ
MKTPLEVLQTRFGFDEFRDGQSEVIETLLRGESAAAVFPTGAGKSLCFQLPAVMLEGMTLVVSPLLALMKDQVDALEGFGVRAARLDSSLSSEEYTEVLKRAREGELKILYVAPERFNNERFRQSLQQFRVSLMAVDEAHCVSEWGHNFRPDYLKLSRYAVACGAERVLALTATATPKVLDDICQVFGIENRVRTPFHRANLHLNATIVQSREEKLQRLSDTLTKRGGPAIVYVTLQRTAMEVARSLRIKGLEARPYHAGLEGELREKTQEWFVPADDGVVVATIAFGMGIDKPNIRGVYHFDPPKSLENYSQEIGRAGRDGAVSRCEFFYHPPDRIPLENFVYGDTPTLASIRSLLREVFKADDQLVLNLYSMSRTHDLRKLVLRTLLTYLELDGYLQSLTPVYSSYRFRPHATSKEILAGYKGQEKKLLSDVLKHSVKKKVWFVLDIDETAKKLKRERQDVVRILDRCSLDGWMEVTATGLRFRYSILKRPDDILGLADQIFEKALVREKGEIHRLNQALGLASCSGCLAAYLAEHFGEELDQGCGTCSVCRHGPRDENWKPEEPTFELGEIPMQLGQPRDVARFLCGLATPKLTGLALTKDPRFGKLRHISFGRVLKAAGGK